MVPQSLRHMRRIPSQVAYRRVADYPWFMSKSEILNALSNLSAEERREILDKLLDLETEGWMDAADLTDEERRLIESRLEAHRGNPDEAIPWEDVEAELIARFGK